MSKKCSLLVDKPKLLKLINNRIDHIGLMNLENLDFLKFRFQADALKNWIEIIHEHIKDIVPSKSTGFKNRENAVIEFINHLSLEQQQQQQQQQTKNNRLSQFIKQIAKDIKEHYEIKEKHSASLSHTGATYSIEEYRQIRYALAEYILKQKISQTGPIKIIKTNEPEYEIYKKSYSMIDRIKSAEMQQYFQMYNVSVIFGIAEIRQYAGTGDALINQLFQEFAPSSQHFTQTTSTNCNSANNRLHKYPCDKKCCYCFYCGHCLEPTASSSQSKITELAIETDFKTGKLKNINCDHVIPIIQMFVSLKPSTVNFVYTHTDCNQQAGNRNWLELLTTVGNNKVYKQSTRNPARVTKDADVEQTCRNFFVDVLKSQKVLPADEQLNTLFKIIMVVSATNKIKDSYAEYFLQRKGGSFLEFLRKKFLDSSSASKSPMAVSPMNIGSTSKDAVVNLPEPIQEKQEVLTQEEIDSACAIDQLTSKIQKLEKELYTEKKQGEANIKVLTTDLEDADRQRALIEQQLKQQKQEYEENLKKEQRVKEEFKRQKLDVERDEQDMAQLIQNMMNPKQYRSQSPNNRGNIVKFNTRKQTKFSGPIQKSRTRSWKLPSLYKKTRSRSRSRSRGRSGSRGRSRSRGGKLTKKVRKIKK